MEPDDDERSDLGTDTALEPYHRRKYPRRHYEQQSLAIVRLQIREAVVRLKHLGYSWEEISKKINLHPSQVGRYYRESIRRSTKRAVIQRRHGQLPPRPHRPVPRDVVERWWRYWEPIVNANANAPNGEARPAVHAPTPRALPPGSDDSPEDVYSSSSEGGSSPPTSSPPPPILEGDVLDSPEITQLKKDCLHLRKAMRPFDEIAELLSISEDEARYYTFKAIEQAEKSEQTTADAERKLMLMQIDQMIAGIHAPATGKLVGGQSTLIDLGAIDRMLKLLKQKAELLGLTEPPAVDIRIKLQQFATESGFDMLEIEEVAREVLQKHKLNLPEFRG